MNKKKKEIPSKKRKNYYKYKNLLKENKFI
jgi:hypothetical protein